MNTGDWEGIYVDLDNDDIPDKSKVRAVPLLSPDTGCSASCSGSANLQEPRPTYVSYS